MTEKIKIDCFRRSIITPNKKSKKNQETKKNLKKKKKRGKKKKTFKIGRENITKLNVQKKIQKSERNLNFSHISIFKSLIEKPKLNQSSNDLKLKKQLRNTSRTPKKHQKADIYESLVNGIASQQEIRTFLLQNKSEVKNIRKKIKKKIERSLSSKNEIRFLNQISKSMYFHYKILNQSNLDSEDSDYSHADKKLILAFQKLTGRKVVIKQYSKTQLRNNKLLKKLYNSEKMIGQAISGKPYFIRFLEAFETEEYLNLVYDHEPVGNFYSFLLKRQYEQFKDTPGLLYKFLKKFFFLLFKALRDLHSEGIIHRDIKHTNILLSPNLEPVICDFEISNKVDSDFDIYNSNCKKIYDQNGSLYFKAPEVIEGRGQICFETDIWAAGVTLYWAYYGHYPFNGNNEFQIKSQILFGMPEFEEEQSALTHLLEMCFQKNPFERISAEKALKHPWFSEFNKKKSKQKKEFNLIQDHAQKIKFRSIGEISENSFLNARKILFPEKSSLNCQFKRQKKNFQTYGRDRKNEKKLVSLKNSECGVLSNFGSTKITNGKKSNLNSAEMTKFSLEANSELKRQPSPRRLKNVGRYLNWLGFPDLLLQDLEKGEENRFNHLSACYQTMTRFLAYPDKALKADYLN